MITVLRKDKEKVVCVDKLSELRTMSVYIRQGESVKQEKLYSRR